MSTRTRNQQIQPEINQDNNQEIQNTNKWRQRNSFWFIVFLVLAEVICMKMHITKLSEYFMIIARFMIDYSKIIGSALYTLMFDIGNFIKDSIGDVFISFYNIFHPLFLILISPFYALHGFSLELVNNYASLYAVVLCLFVASLFFVYFQHIFTNNAKPLTIMNLVSNIVTSVYKRVGLFCADVSSFLVMLNLEYYFQVMPQFITPFLNIFASPFNVISGYCAELTKQSTEKQNAIIFGSVILFGMCMYGAYLNDVSTMLSDFYSVYYDLEKLTTNNIICS